MKTKFTALLIAAALAGGGVAAQEDEKTKAAECDSQTRMVMAVVASRSEGRDRQETTNAVQGSLEGGAAKYSSVVPAVVDWVYALPEDQLGDDVGKSWAEACMKR